MSPDRLSATFAALADPTRRAILAPRLRRNLGTETGRAFRNKPACSLEAFESAGTRGPHRARPRGAVAALPAPGQSAQGHRRLGRVLPAPLGGELRQARQLPQGIAEQEQGERNSTQGEERWPQNLTSRRETSRSSWSVLSMPRS